MPRIGASDKDAADRVARAMHKSAAALLKETGILVEHGRENSPGQKILNGAIGKGRTETLAIAFSALSVAGFAVFRLADASQSCVPGNLDVVERAASHYLEFLPDR